MSRKSKQSDLKFPSSLEIAKMGHARILIYVVAENSGKVQDRRRILLQHICHGAQVYIPIRDPANHPVKRNGPRLTNNTYSNPGGAVDHIATVSISMPASWPLEIAGYVPLKAKWSGEVEEGCEAETTGRAGSSPKGMVKAKSSFGRAGSKAEGHFVGEERSSWSTGCEAAPNEW
jgi:hypothetical protein